MGSIEIYDPKKEKWVPYVSDPDEWCQNFKHLRDGYVQPNNMGRYIVCYFLHSQLYSSSLYRYFKCRLSSFLIKHQSLYLV